MAITLDSVGATLTIGTTRSHTISGSNTYLVVPIFESTTDTVTGVTYNGVAMTLLAPTVKGGSIWNSSLWGLANPTTGTNNVIVSRSGGSTINVGSISYNGVDGTSSVNATATDTQGSVTSITATLTTTVDDCWLVANFAGISNLAASTGSTFRESFSGTDSSSATNTYDSGATIGTAGSKSMTVTRGTGPSSNSFIIALAPFTATSPTVTTSTTTSITSTTATGNGNVTADGGSTITERGVCWGTSTNPTTAGSKATAAGTTGTYTANITGLSASTGYYVRAYAINSVGTSYGSNDTFTSSGVAAGTFTNIVSIKNITSMIL